MATAGVERMRNTMKGLEGNVRSMISDLDGNILFAKLVAEDLEKDQRTDSVKELEAATLEIIKFSNQLRHHCAALEMLRNSSDPGAEVLLQCSRTVLIFKFSDQLRHHCAALEMLRNSSDPAAEVTDFETLIKDKMKALEAAAPSEPEKHHFYQQFKEAVWKVHHAGEPMPGHEQDEFVMLASQSGVVNAICPVSGKPVEDLMNPVRSQICRHIYEHAAVMNHIAAHKVREAQRSRPRPCPCAAAGCPKYLTEDNLVCDLSLRVEIQEFSFRQQTCQAEAVVDCATLRDDEVVHL